VKRVSILFDFDRETHRLLKVRAAELSSNIRQVLRDLVAEEVSRSAEKSVLKKGK